MCISVCLWTCIYSGICVWALIFIEIHGYSVFTWGILRLFLLDSVFFFFPMINLKSIVIRFIFMRCEDMLLFVSMEKHYWTACYFENLRKRLGELILLPNVNRGDSWTQNWQCKSDRPCSFPTPKSCFISQLSWFVFPNFKVQIRLAEGSSYSSCCSSV